MAENVFSPVTWTGNVSATTTVAGQSGAIGAGIEVIRVQNIDATNFAYFAFGTSAADAETNAADGAAIEAGQKEFLRKRSTHTHYAYLGDTGTVLLNVVQGN